MAQMYGKPSSYLRSSELKYAFRALIVDLSGVLLFVILYFWVFSKQNWRNWLVIIFLPIGLWFVKIYKKYEKTADKYYRGGKGEDTIWHELKTLPDDFRVFEDIKMGGSSNIDFVVLGLTGLFTIEVKSHHGQIGFNGQELTLNSQPFPEKDVLKQAMYEALDLHNYIKTKLQKDIFVHPVLVFSNYVKINFGQKPVNKVYVVQKSYLLDLIKNGPQELSSQVILEIASELKKLVS